MTVHQPTGSLQKIDNFPKRPVTHMRRFAFMGDFMHWLGAAGDTLSNVKQEKPSLIPPLASRLLPVGGASRESDNAAPVSNTQRVYRELRNLIIAGDIEPASKLKINELKLHLNSGASPIREALSLLTSDQLVDRIDQRGFRVAPVSQAHFLEILQLRRQLEEIALRASIEHGGADWKASLSLATDELAATERQDAPRWETLHRVFHRELISACRSPILLRFCDQLYDLNIRYRNLASKAVEYDQRNVNEEHRSIVDAALLGHSNVATRLLLQHYTHTGDYLSDLLADIGMP